MTLKYLRTKVIPLDELTPFPGNARRGRVDVIKESLERNGQYRSLVVRQIENGPLIILAGNHTSMALAEAGAKGARCEIIECDDATARRINIVDNRSNDLAEDDQDALADLLRDLDDYAGTGFTGDEIAAMLEPPADVDTGDAVDLDAPNAADDQNTAPPARVVTKAGDVWLLGGHRVMCGDSRDPGHVVQLLAGAVVNLAFTSPPYASQRKYDETSGFTPVPPDEYVEWFAPVAANVAEHLAADGSWFVNIKASADGLDTFLYVHDLVVAHAREWGWHYVTELVWRRIGVPKNVTRRFKNQFEPVFQFSRGDFKMRPDAVRHESDSVPVPTGPGAGNTSWGCKQGGDEDAGSLNFGARSEKKRNGRWDSRQGGNGPMFRGTMSDAQGGSGAVGPTGGEHGGRPGLAYPGNMLPTFSGSHAATGHTAAFPVGLPRFFVLAYTDAGDTVYDPFMGSGSTLLAADLEERTAYGMEISPGYVDVICRRFEQMTGTVPVLESTGQPHSFTDGEQ